MELVFLGAFVFWLFLCSVVGVIAENKGRSFHGFFFLSFALSPLVGFISVMVSKGAQELAVERGDYGIYRKCPACADVVRKEAIKCKHCGSALEPVPTPPASPVAVP